jgi:hypothetical protein
MKQITQNDRKEREERVVKLKVKSEKLNLKMGCRSSNSKSIIVYLSLLMVINSYLLTVIKGSVIYKEYKVEG